MARVIFYLISRIRHLCGLLPLKVDGPIYF
jgi:hypothetical protein